MKQLEADVIVIGAGTAGLAAAMAAAQQDVKVLVFEKASTTGGAGNMAMGPFAVQSRLQKLKQIAITAEDAFKIMMEYTHWRVDAKLVSTYVNRSAETIEWLEKLGVEFADVRSHNAGYYYTWHVVKNSDGSADNGSAANMMKILTERAKETGVKFYFQTPVKKILKENGKIGGVIAEDINEEIHVKSGAIIISSGGFGDSPEMIKRYTGYTVGIDIYPTRIPGVAGDGLRMAWDVGAEQTRMIMHSSCNVPWSAAPSNGFHSLPGLIVFRQPNLIVNLAGERFCNEEIKETTPYIVNPVSSQVKGCAFVIFDNDTKKSYQEDGLDFLGPVPRGVKLSDLDADIKRALETGHENIFAADSLEELAAKTEINPEGLKNTIKEYNQACDTGRDKVFFKNAKYLRPVRQPKFYAGRLFAGSLGSLGGIKINYKSEVLAKNKQVIPGLYAAGNDANTIYGDTYCFYLPGNTFGFAVNTGRFAGESAAEYVKSSQ